MCVSDDVGETICKTNRGCRRNLMGVGVMGVLSRIAFEPQVLYSPRLNVDGGVDLTHCESPCGAGSRWRVWVFFFCFFFCSRFCGERKGHGSMPGL